MTTQATITTTVPWTRWFCVGHSTLRSSPIDSRMKLPAQLPSDLPAAGLAAGWSAGRAVA